MSECLALVRRRGPRKGMICGAAIRGFVAPGIGRCAKHLGVNERTRVRAELAAVRDMYELRGVDPEKDARRDEEHAPEREPAFVDPDGTVWRWEL